MMAKFKVGEVAIIQSKEFPSYNGNETRIITLYFDNNDEQAYRCSMHPTSFGGWNESALRKKKPPEELSTWEEVQEDTGWNPKKVNHNV